MSKSIINCEIKECDIENKHIKLEIYDCQKFCSFVQPTIHYINKDINDIAKNYLDKYTNCFKKCVANDWNLTSHYPSSYPRSVNL